MISKARNGQEVVSRGINKVGRGRNKVSRGRKGQVEVENNQVGPDRGIKYPPVPTPFVVVTTYCYQEIA